MTKFIIYALIATTCASCYSLKKSVDSGDPYTDQINWPEEYIPAKSKFFVHNRIDINATPNAVWQVLIHAENWPSWYEGAENVKVVSADNGKLHDSAVFTWKTMGLDFESTIQEYEENERLSWLSKKKSIQGYHAWLIIPTASGCKLITDEAQHGSLTFLEKTFQPNKLRKLHDVWLAEIKKKAESSVDS